MITTKENRFSIRATATQKNLIARAASRSNKTISEFVLENAIEAAEALADIRQRGVRHFAGEKHRHLPRACNGVTARALQQLLRAHGEVPRHHFLHQLHCDPLLRSVRQFVLQGIGSGFKRHFFTSRDLPFNQQLADRAIEFAILMSILQADFDPHAAADLFKRGLNDRIPFTTPVQVHINYFTMASNGDGKLNSFADIYGRDAPVIASFAQPRQDKVATPPPVIVPIEAPGA